MRIEIATLGHKSHKRSYNLFYSLSVITLLRKTLQWQFHEINFTLPRVTFIRNDENNSKKENAVKRNSKQLPIVHVQKAIHSKGYKKNTFKFREKKAFKSFTIHVYY